MRSSRSHGSRAGASAPARPRGTRSSRAAAGQAAYAADTRARAVLAVKQVFERSGEPGVTIQAVAAASRVSVGSLYHHFGDKLGLLSAAFLDVIGDYRRSVLAAMDAAGGSSRQLVRGLVMAHLAWIERHPGEARLLLGSRHRAAEGAGDQLRSSTRDFVGNLMERFAGAMERGEVKRLSPALAGAIVLGPAQEVARHWLRGPMARPLGDAVPVLADAAWDAIRARAPNDG